MSHSLRWLVPALVVGGLVAGGSYARAADPSVQELQAQLRQLQAKVDALEARQSASAKEIDETVAAIIRDADRRSQLMSMEGFTAGYTSDKGFVLQSADGAYLLHPYIQFQFRHTTDWRADQKVTGNGDSQDGFEVRRLKLGFEGNYGQDLTYAFQWATSSTTGALALEDAWAKYKFADNWFVRAGQFKDPFARESLVSAARQLTADRSLLNNILEGNDNYIQGVSLIYDNNDRFRSEVALTDGFGSANTNFTDPATTLFDGSTSTNPNTANSYTWGVAGRAEYMILGDPKTSWKQYNAFSALGNKTDLLIAGAASDLSQSGDTNAWYHTVDLQWEPEAVKGLSVYGAGVGRYTWIEGNPTATGHDNFYDYGFLAQAGYLLNKQWEPFVRYDYTHLGSDFAEAAVEKDLHEITTGVNYYIVGHNAKFTADVTYLPNGSPIDAPGLGILKQTNSDSQWVGRIQFQLVL